MGTWSDFLAADHELAAAAHTLLFQYGPGLGYLATVRADGGPRIHPVSPVIVDGGLFCFLLDSPKRRDLERDGRYALHSYPPEHSDDEVCLTGIAAPVADSGRTTRIAGAARAAPEVDWRLFELKIGVAVVVHRPYSTTTTAPVSRQIWRG
ncbi:MAG: pyridoxamine 5'-phosphate oxidase [Dactylosporangium sp.]|nr:pyridoxamine 5'-phosphate oxidase family protein [Dactylosporangium sp.]NNJ61579.1 pyridoxamine 5'-phosphate oxidase [Dactylosporangium sp.]